MNTFYLSNEYFIILKQLIIFKVLYKNIKSNKMKRFNFLLICFLCIQSAIAQNPNIKFIDLPGAFNTELEISGMVGHNDTLYLVSERQKIIFLVNKSDFSIISSIDLTKPIIDYNAQNPEDEINIRTIEMEGVTWYKNLLFITDEGNTVIYKYDLKGGRICKMKTNLDMSEFNGNLGIEGISVNPDKKLFYLLRERNGSNQTEIYTLKITDANFLKYENQRYIINNPGNNWRYSDIYYKKDENVIYGLRSYYDRKNPENAKCFVDKIPIDENGFLGKDVIQNNDQTLSESVIRNRCKYVSNLEGIYKTGNTIFIVSDNQRSTRKCDSMPEKTMFIEYILKE